MRIAVVAESYDPVGGGNERSTRQTVERLAERGHDVTLVVGACRPAVADAARSAGTPVVALGEARLKTARRLRAFRAMAGRELASGAYDTSLSVTTAVPAAVVQPRGGTAVETQRQNVARRPTAAARWAKRAAQRLNAKQRALVALERRTMADPRVKRVVAISGYVARQLAEHYALPAERIAVIPNAAVSPRAGHDDAGWERLRAAERQRLGLDASDVAVLFAALNPGLKGWPTLRDALRIGSAAGPVGEAAGGTRVVALLAGGFDAGDERALAAEGLGPVTRVLGRCDDLTPAWAAADACVLPTWYDPCSKVVLEGLMAGRPAVTTRFNGAAEWLDPEGGHARGLVLDDPGDGAALVGALARLADPAARSAMAGACAGLDGALGMDRHVAQLEAVLARSAGRLEPEAAS